PPPLFWPQPPPPWPQPVLPPPLFWPQPPPWPQPVLPPPWPQPPLPLEELPVVSTDCDGISAVSLPSLSFFAATIFWKRMTSSAVPKPSALASIWTNSLISRPPDFHSYRPIWPSLSLSRSLYHDGTSLGRLP